MLSAGTVVTVTIAGEVIGIQTKDDVLASVVNDLSGYPLPVVASDIQTGDLLANISSGQWLHYLYTAHVSVTVPGDTYNDESEVGSTVAGVFEDVAGTTPTAVQATSTRSAPAIGVPPTSSGFFSGLTTELHGALFLIVGLIVLLIVAIGWGKNAPLKVFA